MAEGKVLKAKPKIGRYKIKFLRNDKDCVSWFPVSNLTSMIQSPPKKKTVHCDKISNIFTLSRNDHANYFYFEDSGLTIAFDPPGDGNCQFSAMAFYLRTLGIHRSTDLLHREIINELIRYPYLRDGSPISFFTDNLDIESYINNMSKDGTYGDEITLRMASRLYNVQFVVISSLGRQGTQFISPSGGAYDKELPVFALGHFSESHGMHYVSLSGSLDNFLSSDNVLDTTNDNDISSNNLLRPSNNVSNSHVYGTFSCDPISLPNDNIHAPAESTSDKNDSSHSWSFVGTPSRVEESDSFA